MRQKFIKQIERKPKLVNALIMQSQVKCNSDKVRSKSGLSEA